MDKLKNMTTLQGPRPGTRVIVKSEIHVPGTRVIENIGAL